MSVLIPQEDGTPVKVEEVLAAARQQTGLEDIGDPAILEGLEILLGDYERAAGFTERGSQIAHGSIIAALSNRMRIEDWIRQHPEILDQPVEKPLFVFGLPRTGTTLLINLIHADPARRSFLRWEAFDSVPPPKREELHAGPRYEKQQAQLQASLKFMPHIAAMHYEDADSPTECQFAMAPSFCAQVYDSQAYIPNYHQWFLHGASYLPAFRYQNRLLQYLQSDAPGRWALKNPWHPLFLDDLTSVFPDAQLVMTHRDPVEVVGSACSLVKNVRDIYSDKVDAHMVGEQLMRTFDLMIERALAYKAKHGWDSIYDVQYADVMRDPIGSVRGIYAHFDEPFTPEAEAAMQAYMANNEQGKHGKHAYSLADYGLTPEGVREHFKDYIEKFDIPTKG